MRVETTFKVDIWAKTHGVGCKLVWTNTPRDVFAAKVVLLRWVSVACPGSHDTLGATVCGQGKKLWGQAVNKTGDICSFHAWNFGWLCVAGLPLTTPLIPLSFLSSSWHVNKVTWFFRCFFCHSWRRISRNGSAFQLSQPRRRRTLTGRGGTIDSCVSDNSPPVTHSPLQVTWSTRV